MSTEEQIRATYQAMGVSLSRPDKFNRNQTFEAMSQYGHCLADGFKSQAKAEQYAINYYSLRMDLINQ